MNNNRIKKIIIFGSNAEATYHPINPVKDYFISALSGGYEIVFSDDIKDLIKLSSGEFCCAISYFDLWDKIIPDQAILQIHSFVKSGGGFFIIHNGISIQSNHGLRDIVGAEFKEHPPYQNINYSILKKHVITDNINKFSINEELYLFNFFDFDTFTVLIESSSEDGTSSPALWIKDTGKGRIAYLAPGHDNKTFENDNIQMLIRNTADWCSTNA